MPLLAISANDIDTSGVSLDAPLPQDWLDKELSDAQVTAPGPGQVSARLSRSGNEVVVRGEVSAKVVVPCARCVGPAEIDLKGELSLLLRPAPNADASHAGHGGRSRTAVAGAGRKAASGRPTSRDQMADAAPPREGRAPGAARGAKGSQGDAKKGSNEPEYEFSAEEAEVDTFNGDTVVLDEFVREALLLEMPNFPLCSEACPGIRPAAPAPEADSGEESERVDPRLAPLGALRAKLKPAQTKATPASTTKSSTTPRSSARSSVRPSSQSAKSGASKAIKKNKE